MPIKYIFVGILFFILQPIFSQEEAVKKDRRVVHQIGLQANALITQLVPFDQNTLPQNVNPFALYYSFNNKKSGYGMRTGLGFVKDINSTNDGITKRRDDLTQLALRLGVEKQFQFSSKWFAGFGFDAILKTNTLKSRATTESFFQIVTEINTNSNQYGLGAMGWVRYAISDHFLLGTESSMFYLAGRNKSTTKVSQFNGQFSSATSDENVGNGKIEAPITLYMLVKF